MGRKVRIVNTTPRDSGTLQAFNSNLERAGLEDIARSPSLAPRMTIPSFDSTLRTRVVFGAGSLDRLGELAASLGGHRVLLVTDAGIGKKWLINVILKNAGVQTYWRPKNNTRRKSTLPVVRMLCNPRLARAGFCT